ncbi:hypothetical protein D9757_007213 [Collybiopsis confluens]|uniref:Nudix hydrolase domain-containing protein n=1 Tax=Collybiopsis confluens TaxID=2823264 RepID=A0A8H5HAW2_9AGAR|nr:hypothetical protein D9757_007213 [Collybiopsis confluens]
MIISANPRVGVGVFVVNGAGKFIVGLRKGSHGHGTWALPGGHLEGGESFETCTAREVLEETDLRIKNAQFITATNDIMIDEGKHYVTIWMACEMVDPLGEPKVAEPEKCERWEWVSWEELKGWVEAHGGAEDRRDPNTRPLFLPFLNIVTQRSDFEGPARALLQARMHI